METVVLTIHLILALLLIGVVLMQRSEGAGLLSGGGNMQARPKADALTKATWILATAFIITSLTLTVLATRGRSSGSVTDLLPPVTQSETGTSTSRPDLSLPPPVSSGTTTETAPATPAPATQPADSSTPPAAPAEGAAGQNGATAP